MRVRAVRNPAVPRVLIDVLYDPVLVEKLKKIPGAKFHRSELKAAWSVPFASVPAARELLGLRDGHFYPGASFLIDPRKYGDVSVLLKPDELVLEGAPDQVHGLKEDVLAACSYEYEESATVVGNRRAVKHRVETSLAWVEKEGQRRAVVRFPKGLYRRVKGFLSVYRLRNFYAAPYPPRPAPSLLMKNVCFTGRPRSYQLEALKIVDTHPRATLVMATGAGKTVLAAMIIDKLRQPTLLLTYSADLLAQTAERFEELLAVPVGRVGGSEFFLRPVTVATVQTVMSCLERHDERWAELERFFRDVELVFVDEGHQLGAETILKAALLPNSYYAYALTATPEREDGKTLCIEAGAGPLTLLVPESRLVEEGWVLPVQVRLLTCEHTRSKYRSYQRLYQEQIVGNSARNALLVSAARKYIDEGKQVLVLVKDVANDHGQVLADALACDYIDGQATSEERQRALRRFRSRETRALVASAILTQGVDIPEAEVLVLAHGGASGVELQQKIGRVRRPDPKNPNKKTAIVVDVVDRALDPSVEVFAKQSAKRLAIYKKRGYEIGYFDPHRVFAQGK